jgi:serine/threonine protein kinase
MIGTPFFIAPEVFTGIYGKECDIWSLGITLFYLATGKLPYMGINTKDTMNKIINDEVKFPDSISPDLKDLL